MRKPEFDRLHMFLRCTYASAMRRLGTDDLLWLALRGLAELAERHKDAPAEPSYLLRFALAFVHEATGGDPQKRWVVDAYWRAIRTPEQTGEMARYCRSRDLDVSLRGIYHHIGWDPSMLSRADKASSDGNRG